jgi:hypothetical protein
VFLISDIACFVLHQQLYHHLIVVIHRRWLLQITEHLVREEGKGGCGGEPRRGGDELSMVRGVVVGWVGGE